MMTCDDLRELYELYALGALEETERLEIDAHLARQCPACTAGVRQAVAMNAVVASIVPEVEPPRDLRNRVLASVGAAKPAGSRGFSWWPAWAFTSAALAVAAFLFAQRSRTAAEQLAEARETVQRQALDIERSKQILDFLDQPETRQVNFDGKTTRPPRGNFFVNPKAGVLLIAQNLPELARGKTFQMWVIPKGQAPKPAGIFRSGPSGSATHVLASPVDVATLGAVAISIEPDGGSATPTEVIVVAPYTAGL